MCGSPYVTTTAVFAVAGCRGGHARLKPSRGQLRKNRGRPPRDCASVHGTRLAAQRDGLVEDPRHPRAAEWTSRPAAPGTPAEDVEHDQDAEPPASPGHVSHQVHRPLDAWPERLWERDPQGCGDALPVSLAQRQGLGLVQAIDALVVHEEALASQEAVEHPVPAARPRGGERSPSSGRKTMSTFRMNASIRASTGRRTADVSVPAERSSFQRPSMALAVIPTPGSFAKAVFSSSRRGAPNTNGQRSGRVPARWG